MIALNFAQYSVTYKHDNRHYLYMGVCGKQFFDSEGVTN